MSNEQRWATAVRILGLLCLVLASIAGLEAVAIRHARAELAQLHQEREEAKVAQAGTWVRQGRAEVLQALHGLDAFYADAAQGFGRAGGLCAGGQFNADPVLTYVWDAYLGARAAGKSSPASADAMQAALRASGEYQTLHPDLAAPH